MTQNTAEYEQEQERLQRLSDGESEPDARRLAIPSAPEVNPEVYRDVTPMLFRGFLTLGAEINGVHFVFKSLNQHEFELARFMCGYVESRPTSFFWDVFLSHGVFMVGGQNVLVDRQRWMMKMAQTFRDMQPVARAKVIRHLSELNRRAANASIMTEAYTLENYSRYRWAQLHGLDLTSIAVTGITGSENLGLNWAQLTWRALNYFEDTTQAAERDWENAKFVGSCSAGKGMQKIYNKDHDRHRQEAEDRISRKDKILRFVIEGIPMDDGKTVRNGQFVEVAQTVEQLADQLDRSLRGEQDWHDKVVAEYEHRAQAQAQQRQEHLADLAKAAEKRFDGRYILGGSSTLEGLTEREVQERMERSRQIQAQAYQKGMVIPDEEHSERMSKFMDRYGLLGPAVETTVETSDRDPSGATPIPPSRERGKPWRP